MMKILVLCPRLNDKVGQGQAQYDTTQSDSHFERVPFLQLGTGIFL